MDVILQELNITDDYKQYGKLLHQLTKIDVDQIHPDNFQKQLELIQSNPNHKIIVAKSGQHIIGTITILIEPKFIHNLSKVAHIEDVVVDTAYRTHGIGSKLMLEAIKIAREQGCYKAILDCAETVKPFYLKSGFVPKELQMVRYFE